MSDLPSLSELVDSYEDQRILVEIGKDLITERDPENLLGLILDACRRITGADAGSIFLCESDEGIPVLRFAYSHTFSRDLEYKSFKMPRDESSIAGYVSLTGTVLNIPDVYELDQSRPFRFNRGYDLYSGYRTKSVLVVPMRDHHDAVIGVIQLLNSKETREAERTEVTTGRAVADELRLETPEDFETKVGPFKRRYESLMEAVANQAAIALDNARMIKSIELQFESFVRASVAAIESQDPATSGHSERVARMSSSLMRAVDAEKDGVYGRCSFDKAALLEIEYAGLLHDYGKVYLDPRVFTKAKKLYEYDFAYLVLRIKYLIRTTELGYAKQGLEALGRGNAEEAAQAESRAAEASRSLLEAIELLTIINEPTATPIDRSGEIGRLLAAAPPPGLSLDIDGSPLPMLTEKERRDLETRRGSLNREEYELIKKHVEFTVNFVERIPWPPELANIPEYCAKHHEMLDGSGYPKGLRGDRIPLQARMLAVADVYDALSARDRPYKKALVFEEVRRIMDEEAARGRLDHELVRVFFARRCFADADPA